MNTKWKMLTLAAMLSATTNANAADDNYDEDAYFAETSNYVDSLYGGDQQARPAPVENVPVFNDDVYSNEAVYHDAGADLGTYGNDLEPVAFVGDQPAYHSPNVGSGIAASPVSYSSGNCGTGNCGSSYGDSCGQSSCGQSSYGQSQCRPQRRLLSSADAWMTAEALLWFPQARSTAPLVSTNTNGALRPELDVAGTQVAFGGDDAFGEELAAGFRLDGGFFLSEDFGIGGRFWMLGEQEDKYSNNGTGAGGSIGIPYFDSDLITGQENSLKVAFDDGPAGEANFTGDVTAKLSLDMYAAEGYGRLRLLGGKGYRSDLIGGFSHFGIDEELSLNVNAVQTDNVGGGQGDEYNFQDRVDAENRFYGGQIGFLTSVGRSAWTLTALTKVHLGDMEQTLRYRGQRSLNANPVLAGGVFAPEGDNTDISLTENNFSFVPEANLKLALKLRPHVRFTVGYSFLMWSDVALVGDNMNRNVNTNYIVQDAGGATDAPERPFSDGLKSDSFFVHGLDLGAIIEF